MYVEIVNAGPNERYHRGALEYVMHSYDWPSFEEEATLTRTVSRRVS